MATYKIRGTSHNVIYPYRTETGEQKQQWESYETELEAIQRKAYIDYLQKNKKFEEVRAAAYEYRRRRAIEKAAREISQYDDSSSNGVSPSTAEDNTHRTYREFIEKFLPFYARKKRFSPNTYDSYDGNLRNHILPYFGDRVMSTITSEDIDNFIDHLSKKPCKGSKSYGKDPREIPKLSSPTIKKCYNILMVGFPTAKKWRYVNEIPDTSAPSEKTKKRRAWESSRVQKILEGIDDPILHLAVHIAFVCSLRAGEVAGIETSTIDFHDRSLWITQIVQRVSDKSLRELPKEEIIKVFPKKISTSKSSLILKGPKTEESVRKQYLTTPLLKEIKARLAVIADNKSFFGTEYQDHSLLLCNNDGTPIDPKSLDRAFKDHQAIMQIEDPIEFQGLRKSGQMHKVRLTQNNYQLVAENSGQSPEVLMSNYNEALDSEKRTLALLVETSFYPQEMRDEAGANEAEELYALLEKFQSDPALSQQVLHLLRTVARSAS